MSQKINEAELPAGQRAWLLDLRRHSEAGERVGWNAWQPYGEIPHEGVNVSTVQQDGSQPCLQIHGRSHIRGEDEAVKWQVTNQYGNLVRSDWHDDLPHGVLTLMEWCEKVFPECFPGNQGGVNA